MSRNEWINHQKRTFSKWANNQLVVAYGTEAAQLTDIQEDLKDGTALIQLLGALFSKRGIRIPRYNKKPRLRAQKLDNVSIALQMLEKAKLNDGILKPANICDGQIQFVLGLMWRLVLSHSLEMLSGVPKSPRPGAAMKSPRTKSTAVDSSAKTALFSWVKERLAGYDDVPITDFTTSFRDGIAFNALCHSFKPDGLIDMDSLSPTGSESNLNQAFLFAEKEFGIASLLDTDDMLSSYGPDERSVMTYVSEFVAYEQKLEEEKNSMARLNEEQKAKAAEEKRLADEKRQLELQTLRDREAARKQKEEASAASRKQAEADEAAAKAAADEKARLEKAAEDAARAEALRKLQEKQKAEADAKAAAEAKAAADAKEAAEAQAAADAMKAEEEAAAAKAAAEKKRLEEEKAEAERVAAAKAADDAEAAEAERIAAVKAAEEAEAAEAEEERKRLAAAQSIKDKEEEDARLAEEAARASEEEAKRLEDEQKLAEIEEAKRLAEEQREAEEAAKAAELLAAIQLEDATPVKVSEPLVAGTYCVECLLLFTDHRMKAHCVGCRADVCDEGRCSELATSSSLKTKKDVRVCATCAPGLDMVKD